CAPSDPFGKVVASAKVSLSARHGTIGPPRALEGGIIEWLYTAPRALEGEPESLSAVWRQGRKVSREQLALELMQGPAARVELVAAEPVVHYGARAPLLVRALDALGRPRAGAELTLESTVGSATPVITGADGRARLEWQLPEDGEASRARVTVQARGPTGSEPARVEVWADK